MKTKLELAHEIALAMAADGNVPNENIVAIVWQYADAMQAEAEKRNNTERPKVLFEPKNEVDWSQAPSNAIGWMFFDGVSTWLGEDGFLIEDAPLFGFKDPCIMERPHGF